jgi:hypothetical protein
MSSASSPSSAIWSTDLDHFGVLTPNPTSDVQSELISQPSLASIADLLTPALDAGTANSAEQSQALHDYLTEMLHGDASGMVESRIAFAGSEAERKRSPSTTYVPQYLTDEPPEALNGVQWDGYTLPRC